jgi:hypothetical protein
MSHHNRFLRFCITLSERAEKLHIRLIQQYFFDTLNLLLEKWFENIKFLFPDTEVLKTPFTLHTGSHKSVADENGLWDRSMIKNSSGSYFLQKISGLV